jgi:hypothetical protein
MDPLLGPQNKVGLQNGTTTFASQKGGSGTGINELMGILCLDKYPILAALFALRTAAAPHIVILQILTKYEVTTLRRT